MTFDEVVANGNNGKQNSEEDSWTGNRDGSGLSHTRQIDKTDCRKSNPLQGV